MAVLRVAHVWGDRLLDVQHLADGDRILIDGEVVVLGSRTQGESAFGPTTLRLKPVEPEPAVRAVAEETDWKFAKLFTHPGFFKPVGSED
jgi:hypothetical protein